VAFASSFGGELLRANRAPTLAGTSRRAERLQSVFVTKLIVRANGTLIVESDREADRARRVRATTGDLATIVARFAFWRS